MKDRTWEEPAGHENTRQLLVRGFRVWSNNLKIAVPVVLAPLSIAAWSTLVLLAFVATNPPPGELLQAAPVADPEVLRTALLEYLRGVGTALALAAPVWLAGTLLLSAFFNAGAIGMSIEANELYRCAVSDAWRYGRKHLVSMFLADLFMLAVFAAVAAAFLVPLAMGGEFGSGANPLLVLPMAALLVLGYLFLPVRYALVADSLGPLEAVVEGVSFTATNPAAVLLLGLATLLLSAVANAPAVVFGSLAAEQLYSMAVSLLFTGPYTTVLWTRLYLDRTGQRLVESGSRNP